MKESKGILGAIGIIVFAFILLGLFLYLLWHNFGGVFNG